MKVVVQKFGGTSVRDEVIREKAANHVQRAVSDGYKVVVVVSAMGRNGDPYATDTLLSLVRQPHALVSKREEDLLVSCGEVISSVIFSGLLASKGLQSVAMNGAQAGFYTDGEFGNAKIVEIKCEQLKEKLLDNDVIVVAGFQGISNDGEITTLGRGGSDTSATALGAALDAEWVDIFTDVDGVMTADPQIVNEARPLQQVTYTEICNMAYQGAKVIHPRAVEIAMQAKVPIHIRSTHSDSPGTVITSGQTSKPGKEVEDRPITGIAHMSNIAQVSVKAKDERLQVQSDVFNAMAKAGISVDFINIHMNGVVYTVPEELADKADQILKNKGYEPEITKGCAKVSAVGAGMTGVPGVASSIVTALIKENITILQSADSHTTIWVLVKGEEMEKAVNALHQMFLLEKDEGL